MAWRGRGVTQLLIIARRQDQGVDIDCGDGNKVHVEIASVQGQYVRLAIEAPKQFRITRPDWKQSKTKQGGSR